MFLLGGIILDPTGVQYFEAVSEGGMKRGMRKKTIIIRSADTHAIPMISTVYVGFGF